MDEFDTQGVEYLQTVPADSIKTKATYGATEGIYIMVSIYIGVGWDHQSDEEYLEWIQHQTPGSDGVWKDMRTVTDPSKADYHVGINQPPSYLDNDRLVLFCHESPWHVRAKHGACRWEGVDALAKFPTPDYPQVNFWWVQKSYDELKAMSEYDVEKEKKLSWIVTDKGRNDMHPFRETVRRFMMKFGYKKYNPKGIPIVDRAPTDSHLLRMDFLDHLTKDDPEIFDLYGRGETFSGPHYQGEIDDKWDGVEKYRYTLCIDNWKGPGRFSDHIFDAFLAYSMPLYWGCTNLEEFFPEDSFVEIDIEQDGVAKEVKRISESNLREQNLDAIKEARERVLDTYQIWPYVRRAIKNLDKNKVNF